VTREARFRTVRFRTLAASMVLLLVSISSIRRYCPMSAPVVASEGMSGLHDCCKTGLTGGTPSCCHADTGSNGVATLKSTWAAVMLPALSVRFMPAVVPTPFAIAPLPSVSSHSPPPTVLRI
jgi:hypothetical protein